MALKWGIASAGKISNDFVLALKNLSKSQHEVIAVAAKDVNRAKKFAQSHGISLAYGSYEELATNLEIEVVYIGSLNPQHLSVAKLMLNHGKHVLCEKPLCMNFKQCEELVKLARSKNLFLMEAVWSRFFPVYEKVRTALTKNILGDVLQISVNFGMPIEAARVREKNMGGGAVLDLGVYTLHLAMLVFGRNTPYEIIAAGHLNNDGVDDSYTCIVKYPGGKTATLVLHTRVKLGNDAYIYGTKGFIKIHQPFWCPTKLTINGIEEEFPLPKNNDESYNYVNSSGLHYQANEVYRCIKEGLIESPIISHEDSLMIAKMEDTIRKQLGVKFDED